VKKMAQIDELHDQFQAEIEKLRKEFALFE
jgi:hypothetical protein